MKARGPPLGSVRRGGISGAQYGIVTSRRPRLSVPLEMVTDITGWRSFVKPSWCHPAELWLHTRTGRPLGNGTFIHQIESSIGLSSAQRSEGRREGVEYCDVMKARLLCR